MAHSVVLWLVVRAAVMAALLAPPAMEGSPVKTELADLFGGGAALYFAALTVGAAAIDRRIRRTLPLLNNLGVSRTALLTASGVVALLCEIPLSLLATTWLAGGVR